MTVCEEGPSRMLELDKNAKNRIRAENDTNDLAIK